MRHNTLITSSCSASKYKQNCVLLFICYSLSLSGHIFLYLVPQQTLIASTCQNNKIIVFTHLDINSFIFVLFAQSMSPTMCKLLIAYPQRSNLPLLTHVALGKALGIKSALFLASQVPFFFFLLYFLLFQCFKAHRKARLGEVNQFFVLFILHSFLHAKACMSCHSTTLQLA